MKSKLGLRRWICLVLCMLLLMPSYAFAQAAPANTDIKGHWAEKQISDWLSKGYVSTYNDGSFRPNIGITRAELASVVNKALGFIEKDAVNFKDVNPRDSFYNDMAIAKKAGYLKGNEKGNGNPNNFMSRQEFAVIIQRLMKLEDPTVFKAINTFKDANSIPSWSKGAIESVTAKGYMLGDNYKSFNPKGNVTRAEAIVTLDRSYLHFIRAAYDKAGTYQAETINGSIAINVPDVILENTIVNGDLIIGKGVGEGNVTLKNVTIKGDTIVKGGGMNSIVVENCTLGHLIISKEGNMVRVVAVGSTTTGSVEMQSGGKLETSGTSDSGFGNITIAEAVDTGAPILLVGNFDSVEVQATGINLDLASGSVGSLTITTTAANTNLNIGTGTTVANLTLSAATTLAGTGTVAAATVQGSNVTLGVTGTTTITQLDVAPTAQNSSISLGTGSTVTNMKVDSAASITGTGTIGTAQVNVDGATITAPTETLKTATGVTVVTTPSTPPAPPVTPPTTDGGNSGSTDNNDNTNIAVSAISVTSAGNASTITADNGTLQMSAAVSPSNATNKTVIWSVINETGAASISSTGLLKAISNGTVTVKATANDGSGKYGAKTISISNQIPTVLFSSTRIVSGAVNPDIVVNVDNDSFTASEISAVPSGWTISSGATGLTIGTITRNSDKQVTFHMNGTAQDGALTLKANAATLAAYAESNAITIFILPAATGETGTIEAAEGVDGVTDVQPTIDGQNITFNGIVEYYLANASSNMPKSGNWIGVKITAPEGITPDNTAMLYINGRNLNADGQPGWDNIREEGDGDNYFYLYQRIIDLSRVYNITIKWNNSLTESYMVDFAETATLEAPHGSIERAEGTNGGADATTVIEGQSIKFNGKIAYLEAGAENGYLIAGNWVGVKITAPEGVYPDENAVLIAHGQNCNRDGVPGWENIREEGDGDNYFYLYQRVRQTAYVYGIQIKWNNDVTEDYEIIIPSSTTLEYSDTELNKLGDIIGAATDYYNSSADYGTISGDALDVFGAAIAAAEDVYNGAATADHDTIMPGLYAAQAALSDAIDAFWDAYDTEIKAASSNLSADTEYTEENPLTILLTLAGTGDIAANLEDYLTLNGALSGMTIKEVTYKGNPPNEAKLELIGTSGSNLGEASLSIIEGGVNGHHHGFEAIVMPWGTIERAENFNGGESASTEVFGHEIWFYGEIEYLEADAINGLPIPGNFVGVKITAPAGVMPDETAMLTIRGQNCNLNGEPGWNNIREEGDGDNYFYVYQRVRMTGYVYEIEIKWNSEVTENYSIMIPRATTLQYSQAEFDKLQNMHDIAVDYRNGERLSEFVDSNVIDALDNAIGRAETVMNAPSMPEIYAAQDGLAVSINEVQAAYRLAFTNIINAEFSDGEARTTYVLNESDYTEDRWAAYIAAMDAAIGLEGTADLSPAAIEQAIAAIEEAKRSLTVQAEANKITEAELGLITTADADSLLQKAQSIVSEGYTVTVKEADGVKISADGVAIEAGDGTIIFIVTDDAATEYTAETKTLSITVQ